MNPQLFSLSINHLSPFFFLSKNAEDSVSNFSDVNICRFYLSDMTVLLDFGQKKHAI